VDQAGARSTNVVSTVGGFGTKSTRSASAYLTLRPGSEEGWSITSGKLESGSEVSVGACGETASSRAWLRDPALRQGTGRASADLHSSAGSQKQQSGGELASGGETTRAQDATVQIRPIRPALSQRNADVPPNRRIEFRMGINVGDIIRDGRDIYGDGVNVAGRLERVRCRLSAGGDWIRTSSTRAR
jgi:hypothetical protein